MRRYEGMCHLTSPTSQKTRQSEVRSLHSSTDHYSTQPNSQLITTQINRSANQSMNQARNQSVSQPTINQSIIQSISHSLTPSLIQKTDQPNKQTTTNKATASIVSIDQRQMHHLISRLERVGIVPTFPLTNPLDSHAVSHEGEMVQQGGLLHLGAAPPLEAARDSEAESSNDTGGQEGEGHS